MKKIIFLIGLSLLTSCSKVSNYDKPNTGDLAKEQDAKAKAFTGTLITYAQLRAKVSTSFTQYNDNEAFEGYVISSDEAGNFYKKVYVQAPDKSGTIAVAIDKKGLYGEYPIGTKVQVRLQGTTVWFSSRYSLLEVGYGHGKTAGGNTKISNLPSAMYEDIIIPTTEKAPMSQLATSFDNLSFDKSTQENKLLILNNVSFQSADVGKPFHNPRDQYNTTYTLTDGASGTLPFLTSSYASYIKDLVPAGKLRITGVLTKYGNNYQFYINAINDIQTTN
ncbi:MULTISPECIES: DUF5689 domain-containing protein [unclassified Capnocytophaga]|jgi:hypothetical protein|uniref:DUF5689 domain-containing protein n=1 Tax=unclassified Capnocytophaga TaxID=2640652 RepID=UPI000202F7D7|nr:MULTISPECIES: DUF5689 domain-containing protein [unclassified Capnocytophaga]EGD35402.1 hypothetical protein HMPREF9071_0071 [Capnocytophaga sp. oral taxon 338 str. F0234]MEB3005866.1 DUF5689 domain-containing protein [Capnocytophaga sp. G2]